MSSMPLASYLLPGGVKDPRQALTEAREAERIGMGALWLGERFDTKDFPSILGAVSQVTSTIPLGVGITPMNMRHPVVLASAGQTLQSLSNGRFRMGFGRSADWRWKAYGLPSPTLDSMRDVATVLRQLWAGQTVNYNGPAGTFPNLRLPERNGLPPPPLYLAAIGPKTLALAGSAFDGVILHPVLTPEAVRESVRLVRAGAAAAGRDPAAVRIVATVVTASDMPDHDADLAINARAAGYLEVPGLGDAIASANKWSAEALAAYRNDPRLRALGGKQADKALSRDELIALTRVLPADWLPAASARGSAAACAAKLREYLDAGADEILIHGATADRLGSLVAQFR